MMTSQTPNMTRPPTEAAPTPSAPRRPTPAIWLGAGLVALLLIAVIVAFAAPGGGTTTNAPTAMIAVPVHQTVSAVAPVASAGDSVRFTLTAEEKLISIAPGIAYHAWTFNGTVPGPVIRVRQGQVVHFTLTNADTTMAHSIDFHAAQTPWNVNYRKARKAPSFQAGDISAVAAATLVLFPCTSVQIVLQYEYA